MFPQVNGKHVCGEDNPVRQGVLLLLEKELCQHYRAGSSECDQIQGLLFWHDKIDVPVGHGVPTPPEPGRHCDRELKSKHFIWHRN